MKHRLMYAGLVAVLAIWLMVVDFSMELLNAASDLRLFAGGALILGSIIVFPTVIRRLFGKTIKQDMDALIDSSFGDHTQEKK